jgi:lipopolysaccharide/colanic/teichoic acid biosynthesis glycosyltransferase
MKSVIPLIIDCEIPYLRRSATRSLLAMPLGQTSLLEHLAPALARVSDGDVVVMPAFAPPPGYEESLSARTSTKLRVIARERLAAFLGDLETADCLLVVEPRYWPLGDHDFSSIVAHVENYRGATHILAMQAGVDDVQERVECDSDGLVRRVQRFYDAVDCSCANGSAIVCTLVPARAVVGVRFNSLMDLRLGLLARGGLSRDVPLDLRFLDLGQPPGLLALSDHILERSTRDQALPGFEPWAPGVFVGRNSRIHPTARLIPPVVIHPDTVVEEGVTVIGPALVGAGSRLGRKATIAQAYLHHGTEVCAGTTVRHHVCEDRCAGSPGGREVPPGVSTLTALPTERWRAKEMERLAEQAGRGRQRVDMIAKRAIDLVLAITSLLVLAPLMLVVALLVKVDSAGPVFFLHRREGRGGKEFSCVKFRTMSADAHRRQRQLYENNEVDGPQFKLKEDPRVTRIGRLLRATNFDEIPQLINVLLGHMTLVGPRPSPFRENQICVPWRRARLSVRPGITGLWQVCRDEERTEGDFHEWIYYDLTYVRHFSVWLDLKILLATVVTLGGRSRMPVSWLVRESVRGAATVKPALT